MTERNAALSDQEFRAPDVRFHRALVDAGGNALLQFLTHPAKYPSIGFDSAGAAAQVLARSITSKPVSTTFSATVPPSIRASMASAAMRPMPRRSIRTVVSAG